MKRIKLFFSILLVAFTLFLVSCEAGPGPFAVTSIQKVGQNEEGYIYEITFIDNNSYQFIVPFGVDGEPGKDGSTPYIGENGNWWLGDTDLGLSAQGPKGDQGESGNDGIDGETLLI